MVDRVELARNNFLKGYNCAQAIAVAFHDLIGLTEEEAAKMASPFGGGFGRMREVCGAVSGMTLVLGALEGNPDPSDQAAKTRIYERERELLAKFQEAQGSIICRELLGLRKDTKESAAPSERTTAYYQGRSCLSSIELAARILEEYVI